MLEGNTDVCMRKVMEITRSLVFLCFLLDFVRLACEYGHLSSIPSGFGGVSQTRLNNEERWKVAVCGGYYSICKFFFFKYSLKSFFFFANDSIGRFGKYLIGINVTVVWNISCLAGLYSQHQLSSFPNTLKIYFLRSPPSIVFNWTRCWG